MGCVHGDVMLEVGIPHVHNNGTWEKMCSENTLGTYTDDIICQKLGLVHGYHTMENQHYIIHEEIGDFYIGTCRKTIDFPYNCNKKGLESCIGNSPSYEISCEGHSKLTRSSCCKFLSLLSLKIFFTPAYLS